MQFYASSNLHQLAESNPPIFNIKTFVSIKTSKKNMDDRMDRIRNRNNLRLLMDLNGGRFFGFYDIVDIRTRVENPEDMGKLENWPKLFITEKYYYDEAVWTVAEICLAEDIERWLSLGYKQQIDPIEMGMLEGIKKSIWSQHYKRIIRFQLHAIAVSDWIFEKVQNYTRDDEEIEQREFKDLMRNPRLLIHMLHDN